MLAGVLAGAALVGCASPAPAPAPAPSRLAATTTSLGESVRGRAIECITIGHGPRRIMFLASIHGDEPAGTPLLERLIREATNDPDWMDGCTLIVIPNANPDGYESNRRGNANGVDLNRNFPAMSFTSRRRHGESPLSEPESEALHDAILEHRPHRIVSIHQPLSCIDYDGEGEALSLAMADAIDPAHRLPVKKLGAYPGSLGSFAGEDLGIPIITVEFSGTAHRLGEEELWSRYGDMLIAAIVHPD